MPVEGRRLIVRELLGGEQPGDEEVLIWI
jgi:hypothetical protein